MSSYFVLQTNSPILDSLAPRIAVILCFADRASAESFKEFTVGTAEEDPYYFTFSDAQIVKTDTIPKWTITELSYDTIMKMITEAIFKKLKKSSAGKEKIVELSTHMGQENGTIKFYVNFRTKTIGE